MTAARSAAVAARCGRAAPFEDNKPVMSVFTQFLQTLSDGAVGAPRRHRSRRFDAVILTGMLATGLASAASAQTIGLQQARNGLVVKQLLGFAAAQQPGDSKTPVDPTGTLYNFIANPYMAVVQGVNADRSTSYAEGQISSNAISLSIQVAGALSFGNLGGSLRIANDNKRALNGFGFGDSYDGGGTYGQNGGGVPSGYGVWPLPGYFLAPIITGIQKFDYSSYIAANVDGVPTATGGAAGGTSVPVVGSDGKWDTTPTVISAPGDKYLLSVAPLGSSKVSLRQEIRLLRNTAQLKWQAVNSDTISHTVYIKFVVNQRVANSERIDANSTGHLGTTRINNAFFYVDPNKGPTLRAQIYGNGGGVTSAVPNEINMLGARYQVDNTFVEPYHSRFILNGFGATIPSTVFVGDSQDLYPLPTAGFPNAGSFAPPDNGKRLDKMENGTAVAVYFGPIQVAPGSTSAPTITYYGNGDSTDSLDPDFTIGTETEEAFQYNSNAANTLNDQQRANPSLDITARQFLTPQALTIYGSVYNRQLSEAQFDITLKDVKMNITLPDALRFTTSPITGAPDTATKSVGDIPGDTDKVAAWTVEPTGRLFGTFSYQMTAIVGGISPLSRTVSRAITIPATPLVNVSADYYQMIGFPFEFDKSVTNNNDTTSIFNGLSKPADTNPGSSILYKWIPDPDSITGAGKYQAVTTIERGVAYFYRPALSRLLFLKGARPDTQATPPDTTSRVQFFQIVLERGWNMISNPWVYGVPVSFISLANIDNNDPNSDLNLTYFPDAVASGLVRGGIFFYNPDKRDYDFFQDFTQELKPYQGYWIFVEDRKILRIAVPSQKQSALLPDPTGNVPVTRKKEPAGAILSGRAFPLAQTSENWKMQLSAKRVAADVASSAQDSATLLGVSPNSKDSDDSTDLPKPPPIVSDYVAVSVLHQVKSGKTRAFLQDMKAPGGKKTWEIEVASDKDGPVSLSWPNLSRLPRNVRLTLTDKQTNRSLTMSGSSSLVVNVSAGKPSRFVVTADRQLTRPLAFSNVRITHSGTRGVNGTKNFALAFRTTADANVDARVINLQGKFIGNFDGGRAVTANSETRLVWNGRARDGSPIPGGPYIVEINGRGENGENITVKHPITILE